MVVVTDTAFPLASTMAKCVVCRLSFAGTAGALPDDISPISARNAAAVSFERNDAKGIFTNAGSPSSALRRAKARRSASASR